MNIYKSITIDKLNFIPEVIIKTNKFSFCYSSISDFIEHVKDIMDRYENSFESQAIIKSIWIGDKEYTEFNNFKQVYDYVEKIESNRQNVSLIISINGQTHTFTEAYDLIKFMDDKKQTKISFLDTVDTLLIDDIKNIEYDTIAKVYDLACLIESKGKNRPMKNKGISMIKYHNWNY